MVFHYNVIYVICSCQLDMHVWVGGMHFLQLFYELTDPLAQLSLQAFLPEMGSGMYMTQYVN